MHTATMNMHDVNVLAKLHRDQPRKCTLFTVALALELRTRQEMKAASPSELARLTGVHYDNAKRAVREARRYLEDARGGDHSVIPQGSPSDPPRDHPMIPPGITQVSPGGSPSDPHKDLRIEDKNSLSLAHAGACEADPNPPSPEPEREAVREWAARVAPNLDYWTANAVETWPAPWVRAVIERKAIGRKATPSPALLTKILQDWARAGECEYLAGPLPLRPTGTAGNVRSLADDLRDL